MKDGAVVQTSFALILGVRVGPFARAFGKLDEVLDRDRRLLFEEAADNSSFAGVQGCINAGLPGHDDSFR